MKSVINLEALVCERIQENLDLNQTMLNDLVFRQLVTEAGAALVRVLKHGKKVLLWKRG